MNIVYIPQGDKPFQGSSTYRRRVNIAGLEIEVTPNGGMSDPGFWVTVNGTDYPANSIEEVEAMIRRLIQNRIPDAEIRYPTYGHGIDNKTMEPWRRG